MKLIQRNKPSFSISEVSIREVLQDIVLNVGTNEAWSIDPLQKVCKYYLESTTNKNLTEVAYTLIEQMYRVGVVGVKVNPERHYEYSHIDAPILSKGQLGPDSKIRIHPMLHRALGLLNS